VSGFSPQALVSGSTPCPSGVDPTRYILGDWWKEEDLPVHWDRVFPGGPMTVEVGFGGGEFLVGMAAASPDARFVGIERFGEGHRRLLAALPVAGVRNVLSMVGDAYILMNLAFADASLTCVTVNFSDPWPKARHARNRLLTAEFLDLAARKLERGGLVTAATDDAPYAQQAAEAFDAVESLESRHPGVPWLTESPHPVRTRYERKWIAEGRPLHYFTYAKI